MAKGSASLLLRNQSWNAKDSIDATPCFLELCSHHLAFALLII